MANFCLIPSQVDKFIGALREGKIDPAQLADMTSEERHAFFGDIVGKDNAQGVNGLFESKLLLKNQQQGMISWAKKVGSITPPVRRDLISRIEKLDRVLNPDEQEQFLHDLASTRLGVDVSQTEAKMIATMSQTIQDTKTAMHPDYTFPTEEARLAHGRAKVAMMDYVGDLKNDANRMRLGEIPHHPVSAVRKLASNTASLAKSLKASLDNSAIGRQGFKIMVTEPRIWAKNAGQSFVDLVRQFGGKPVMDEVRADVMSRPNALNGLYNKERLAVGVTEETFPTTLPEKIPGLGRAFKASESAFTAFQYRTRADLFDKWVQIADKSGADIQGIGKVVNSLTGRGNLGGLEPAASTVNNFFFSPRSVKGNFDALTAHITDKNMGTFARQKAATNLVKMIAGTAAILGTANAVMPGSVDLDPRSSDFGKIKVGDTRFDVTGGAASLITLAARILPSKSNGQWGQYSKSSTTGEIKKLNSGYGSQNGMDVLNSFSENKLSPAASIVKDMIKQQDFKGGKPTVTGELTNLLAPLPVVNYQELKGDSHSANVLLATLADALGVATNTYGKSTTDWGQNTGAELKQFKESVTPEQFKAANNEFNKRYDEWFQKEHHTFVDLPNDQKANIITQAKTTIKNSVFKDAGFKYKAPKTPNQKPEILNSLK